MNRIIVLLLSFAIASWASAQGVWFAGIGATRTLVGNHIGNDYIVNGAPIHNDSLKNISSSATGRFGFYAEFGRDIMLRKGSVLTGWEWGLHFKSLRAKETFSVVTPASDASNPIQHEEIYSSYYPGLFLNFYKEFPIIDGAIYMRHNLGVNADYGLLSRSKTVDSGVLTHDIFGPQYVGQIHYRLSFPLQIFGSKRITPSIETPILNVVPWSDGRSTLEFFNFRYRPLLICIRFDLNSRGKKDRKCTGVPEKRERPELWGPEMRKFRK